jgi:hypothetical protein
VGCDDLLSGEEAKISKLKVGSQLKIHGFASQEGDAGFIMICHAIGLTGLPTWRASYGLIVL